MVFSKLAEKMNGRGLQHKVATLSKGRIPGFRKGKAPHDQGSMVRKLPPPRPKLDDPLFASEVAMLRLYQGYAKEIVPDWEETVTDVPMLHKVCFEGYVSTAKELIENGEEVNQRITHGPKLLRFLNGGFETYTAFFLHSTPIMMAAHQGHTAVIKLLLKHGASVDETDSIGCTALYLAVSNQRMDACRLLHKHGADINSADTKYNFTPLILACRKNDTELAKWIIKKGANVKQQDVYGRTGLHYAAWNYNHELVQLLLTFTLDVNGRDYYGWSPIQFTVGEIELDQPVDGFSGLSNKIGLPTEIKTQIHRGLGKAGEEWLTILALLEQGSDPNHLDPKGDTPLQILAARLPSAVLSDGLVHISERKKNEMLLISMMLLIEKGASLHIRNREGMTVMDICRARDNYMADRLFDELTDSVSMQTLNTVSGSTSMGSAATTATMGFYRHFSIDAMEDEIRQLVDMLLAKLMSRRKRKGLRRRYGKGCVIS